MLKLNHDIPVTSPFSFLSTLNISASDVHSLYFASSMQRIAQGLQQIQKLRSEIGIRIAIRYESVIAAFLVSRQQHSVS